MIRCNDEEIVGFQSRQEGRKGGIELLQGLTVTQNIATVAMESVKVDEVGHDEGAFSSSLESGQGLLPECRVATGPDFLAYASVSVDVADLAYAENRTVRLADFLKDSGSRGRDCEIVTVAGAFEILGAGSEEGSGDDPSDHEVTFVEQAAGAAT